MEISKLMKKRIADNLKEGKRFDGRKLDEFRDIKIETGISVNAEGSARVTIGDTVVVAGVKMATSEPYTDHEDEGTLVTTAELLPISSPRYEPGPPKIEAVELARIIDRGIRESKFIDFKKLCIKKDEKVWSIFLDLYSINDAGSLIDACSLAAVAALMSAKLPVYDAETDTIKYGEYTKDPIPLTEKVCLNFTAYKVGKSLIFDPTREEEDSSEARLSVAMTRSKGKIYVNSLQRGEDEPLTPEEVLKILEMAEKKYEEVEEVVKKQIK